MLISACCVASAARSPSRRIRQAIAFHLDGMREQRETPPEPTAWTELVEA